MTVFHYRVAEPGKIVHAFCGVMAPRTQTKKFRHQWMYLTPAQHRAGDTVCDACAEWGGRFNRTGKPVTLARLTAAKRRRSEGVFKPGDPDFKTTDPLVLLAHAQAVGEYVGLQINAKRTAAEKAVARAKAAVAALQRKLRMTTTCLKNAKKRVVLAEKKLAKTERYEPPPQEEEDGYGNGVSDR